ncbi:MAG: nitrite/sulfite reductase, partial [Candidatus Omnitrophica bacterium]|nr:nitrite/sulfite reductase [Candidatus Omnitrophota bacterium]
MMRIKIPLGRLNAEQLECLAGVADDYSKGIGHLTTRQDMQLYWIPARDAPIAMAQAASVGLTTREACGNSVRNVTACPIAGLSPTEAFDVTKHAFAVTRHFLRNPASQKLPRKFKIAFEGCPVDHARTPIHDIGAVAAIQEEGGKKTLGFRIYAGGGLGAAPMQAILVEPFTPTTDLLRTCEAIVRVHDRLGDRKNKATARIKFVVKRLGPEAFRKEVFAEREQLPRYAYPDMQAAETDEKPPSPAKDIPSSVSVSATVHGGSASGGNGTFKRWMFTNVLGQKQRGFSMVTIRLRLGDISSDQMRALAKITRRYCGGRLRISIEQNLLLCWIRNEHLSALFGELEPIGLAETEANTLYDVTSCPGAETCQLGIAASRGLARAVETQLKQAGIAGEDVDNIHIKISGCPNSCGQHHIADIGFFGGARKVNDHLAPHFQLMLGGMTQEGKAIFGEPILKLPARRIPEAIVGILQRYRQDRASMQEPFRTFVTRVGAGYWKTALEPFTVLPAYDQSPDSYRDWGAETDFSLGGMGPGECAA